jgi:hypothetical protein
MTVTTGTVTGGQESRPVSAISLRSDSPSPEDVREKFSSLKREAAPGSFKMALTVSISQTAITGGKKQTVGSYLRASQPKIIED